MQTLEQAAKSHPRAKELAFLPKTGWVISIPVSGYYVESIENKVFRVVQQNTHKVVANYATPKGAISAMLKLYDKQSAISALLKLYDKQKKENNTDILKHSLAESKATLAKKVASDTYKSYFKMIGKDAVPYNFATNINSGYWYVKPLDPTVSDLANFEVKAGGCNTSTDSFKYWSPNYALAKCKEMQEKLLAEQSEEIAPKKTTYQQLADAVANDSFFQPAGQALTGAKYATPMSATIDKTYYYVEATETNYLIRIKPPYPSQKTIIGGYANVTDALSSCKEYQQNQENLTAKPGDAPIVSVNDFDYKTLGTAAWDILTFDATKSHDWKGMGGVATFSNEINSLGNVAKETTAALKLSVKALAGDWISDLANGGEAECDNCKTVSRLRIKQRMNKKLCRGCWYSV